MNFNFGEVLTRAWEIIWKNKILWIFGILASCGRGGGGGGGGGRGGGTGENGAEQFGQWASQHTGLVVLLVIVFLILILLFAFLSAIGRIGLIKGTYTAEQGAEQLSFGELFSDGMPYVGRVFALSFLFGLVFLIILLPIVLLGIFTGGLLLLCLLPLICILIPAAWAAGIVVEQANAAIVVEDLGLRDGLRRGWDIVRGNLGPALIMGLILSLIDLITGLVIVIPILIVVIPSVLIYVAGNGQSVAPLALTGVCVCLYLPIALFLRGIIIAYIQSAWALTYLRLAGGPGAGSQPKPADNPPAPLDDANKTILAGSSSAGAQSKPDDNPPAPVDDSNKTVIHRSPQAEAQPKPDDNPPPSEPEDPNRTVIGRPPQK